MSYNQNSSIEGWIDVFSLSSLRKGFVLKFKYGCCSLLQDGISNVAILFEQNYLKGLLSWYSKGFLVVFIDLEVLLSLDRFVE